MKKVFDKLGKLTRELHDALHEAGSVTVGTARQERFAQAISVAEQLAAIQVRVTVRAEPKAQYYPRILRRDAGFYLMGWTPSTYDAHGALNALAACPRGDRRSQATARSMSASSARAIAGFGPPIT